jgi:hypothetical protein
MTSFPRPFAGFVTRASAPGNVGCACGTAYTTSRRMASTPLGITWRSLIASPGRIEVDHSSLVRALDELETARALVLSRTVALAAQRRLQKREGRRIPMTPHPRDSWGATPSPTAPIRGRAAAHRGGSGARCRRRRGRPRRCPGAAHCRRPNFPRTTTASRSFSSGASARPSRAPMTCRDKPAARHRPGRNRRRHRDRPSSRRASGRGPPRSRLDDPSLIRLGQHRSRGPFAAIQPSIATTAHPA